MPMKSAMTNRIDIIIAILLPGDNVLESGAEDVIVGPVVLADVGLLYCVAEEVIVGPVGLADDGLLDCVAKSELWYRI